MSSSAKRNPRSVLSATSASATTVADTTVTNQLARLKLSPLQARLLVASRLQCSVDRICARTATGAGSVGCSSSERSGKSTSCRDQSRSMTQSMQAVSAAMSEGSIAGYIATRSWLRPSLR